MTESDRRLGVAGWLGFLGVFGTICCLGVSTQLAIRSALHGLINQIGRLPAIGLIVLAVVLCLAVRKAWRRLARRRMIRWCAHHGWAPVDNRTEWPWTSQRMKPDDTVVSGTFRTTIAGFPIIVGDISWEFGGPGGVHKWEGRGVFAVMRLPRAYPLTAVRRRRTEVADDDMFVRKFRIFIDDVDFADVLTSPTLRRAHVAGQVPPWAIVGDELYAVVASRHPLSPRRLIHLTGQMLHLARLLAIQPGVA